ncbi:MAG TPA: hypothetical protein VFG89_10755 [Coriobacteriia bacterium]|nr:hypothetical protein [Coriobacteriia bacterium]
MPYETDPKVLEWFERTLADPRPNVRRRAVELLDKVDSASRERWLDAAERDSDPRVAGTAVLVHSSILVAEDASVFELLESDFGTVEGGEDLAWEWEYLVVVCEGSYVPAAHRIVFLREEDDATAREVAVIKASYGRASAESLTPVIVDKRLVSRYTRSPRSAMEAQMWKSEGRPRYIEHDEG